MNPTEMWDFDYDSSSESSNLLYNSVSFLIRNPSSADVATNSTRPYVQGTIRDTPHAFFFVCCLFLSVIGTILNALTIMTICSMPSRVRKDATHTFILNLSIADLLLSCVVIPTHWLQIVYRKVDFLGEFLCDVTQALFFWIFELSLFTLSVVSINRMVKICYNASYPTIFSKNTIRFLIAFLWIASLIFVLPPCFDLYGSYIIFEKTKSTGVYYCGLMNSTKSLIRPTTLYYTLGFFVPFLSIAFSYWMIYSKVKEHRSHFRGNNADARNYKLFQTIAVIFVSFIVCYVPNLIFRGWMSWTPKFKYLRQLVKALMYGNTVLNPIIYFTMNTEYQNAYYRLVDKQKRRLKITTPKRTETLKVPESKSSDPETAGTPLDLSDHDQAGGRLGAGATKMMPMGPTDSSTKIVIIFAAIVGFLAICILIADFIRHRSLPA